MGRKGNNLKWAFEKIILEYYNGNRKELEYVCKCLLKIRYIVDAETDEIRKKIYNVLGDPLVQKSQLIEAIALFLEYVDIDFLKDLFLNSPEGFIVSSCENFPPKEMEIIVYRMREKGFLDKLLEEFPKEAEGLLEFEL